MPRSSAEQKKMYGDNLNDLKGIPQDLLEQSREDFYKKLQEIFEKSWRDCTQNATKSETEMLTETERALRLVQEVIMQVSEGLRAVETRLTFLESVSKITAEGLKTAADRLTLLESAELGYVVVYIAVGGNYIDSAGGRYLGPKGWSNDRYLYTRWIEAHAATVGYSWYKPGVSCGIQIRKVTKKIKDPNPDADTCPRFP